MGDVDTLLGQLVTRLKRIGLYDRALVVVTSDHGGSFIPGRAFRRLTDDTVADIAPIPLLIKAPQQREGAISDRNVETIDILPTIADMRLGVLWFQEGRTDAPAAAQRIELPHALVPGDSVDVAFELMPMAETKPLPKGEYEAWIGMMQEGVGWFYPAGDSVRKLRVVHNPRP